MTETPKLRGLATVTYRAADWSAANEWYTELIGFEPHNLRDGYAEWGLGVDQDEFGPVDSRDRLQGAASGPGGHVLHWHVARMFERLLALGATKHAPPQVAATAS